MLGEALYLGHQLGNLTGAVKGPILIGHYRERNRNERVLDVLSIASMPQHIAQLAVIFVVQFGHQLVKRGDQLLAKCIYLVRGTADDKVVAPDMPDKVVWVAAHGDAL